ncbi:MAG TPA: hypothetical protein VF974_08280 [Patescibacteria group bacterium]
MAFQSEMARRQQELANRIMQSNYRGLRGDWGSTGQSTSTQSAMPSFNQMTSSSPMMAPASENAGPGSATASGGFSMDSNPTGVSQALQTLRGLKNQLVSGQMTSADYLRQATPIIEQTANTVGNIAGQGSEAANSVNPIWQQIQNSNFVKADQGKWVAQLPLTEQEYATLPDTAKPTADQIKNGLVPTSALPGNVGVNTMIQNQQDQQKALVQQAQKESETTQQNTQKQLQDLYSNFMSGTKQRYDQSYEDISKSLQNQQNQAMQNLTTGPQGEKFREYFNNLGLLNSGAFNTGLADQFGQIQQNTQNSLLQAKLDEQNALQNSAQQGVNALGQFGIGGQSQLQDIQNQGYQTLSGLGQAGLQRQFSLQDFYTNADFQKQLADLQNNRYMSALNQQKQNPWETVGLGFAGGLGQGIGSYLGRK